MKRLRRIASAIFAGLLATAGRDICLEAFEPEHKPEQGSVDMTQYRRQSELPLFMRTIPQAGEFDSYDREHPEIWREFERYALRLIRSGVKRYGAKAIFEVIRFHRAIRTGPGDCFKVNNNFTAGYARKFVAKYPQHSGFFELRKAEQRSIV